MSSKLVPQPDFDPIDLEFQSMLLEEVLYAQDAVIIRDLEDRVRFWNKGAERLYGWLAEEIIGKNIYDCLFPGEVERPPTRSLHEAGEWAGELQQVTKSQQTIIVESRWKLQLDESGLPKYVLMVNRDISERKQLEAEIVRAQRIETIGHLSMGIVHNLNNVLSTLLISLSTLSMDSIDPEDREGLESSRISAEHAAQLITELLSLTKEREPENTPIDLGNVVTQMARVLKSTFPRSIKIDTTIPSDLHAIPASTTHMCQLLLNLCMNARDALPSGGTLTIETRNVIIDESAVRTLPDSVAGKYVMLSVSDTGIGIPAEITHRIFEPFFTTKRHGKGTGLGLFTVASIVKDHGGFINLYRLKRGTQFRVYLPAAKSS